MSKAKSQKMKCVEPDVKGPPMRMHNPPHPGQALREYLARRPGRHHGRSPSAHYARDALARAQRQGRNLRRHGHPPGGRPGHHARAVDEYAVAVRPVASAGPATRSSQICSCRRVREMLMRRLLSLARTARRLRVVLGEACFEVFRAEDLEVNVFL